METALRVALYVRVSTHDQQTLPLQIEVLREYAQRRDWQVVREVSEAADAHYLLSKGGKSGHIVLLP